MKCLIAIAIATVALGASADLKVATVDMMKLVKKHPSYETNKAALTSAEKDYQKRIDQLKDDVEQIQADGNKLAEQARNPMLAAAAKQKLEREMMDIQDKFMAAQQKLRNEAMSSQQKLTELENRLLKAQTDSIREKVRDFAKAGGYDVVMDSAAAIYAVETLDVTDEVLKTMGVGEVAAAEPAPEQAQPSAEPATDETEAKKTDEGK